MKVVVPCQGGSDEECRSNFASELCNVTLVVFFLNVINGCVHVAMELNGCVHVYHWLCIFYQIQQSTCSS